MTAGNQAAADAEVSDEQWRVDGGVAVVRRLRGSVVSSAPPRVPLVLVPGCGRDHRAFDPLLHALRPHDVDVVVVCLPGRCGIAGPPAASASAAADFVRGLLNEAGIERAVIGGHSFGGAVALELALVDAERCAGLVLLSTACHLARTMTSPIPVALAELVEIGLVMPPKRWIPPPPLSTIVATERTDPLIELSGTTSPDDTSQPSTPPTAGKTDMPRRAEFFT